MQARALRVMVVESMVAWRVHLLGSRYHEACDRLSLTDPSKDSTQGDESGAGNNDIMDVRAALLARSRALPELCDAILALTSSCCQITLRRECMNALFMHSDTLKSRTLALNKRAHRVVPPCPCLSILLGTLGAS